MQTADAYRWQQAVTRALASRRSRLATRWQAAVDAAIHARTEPGGGRPVTKPLTLQVDPDRFVGAVLLHRPRENSDEIVATLGARDGISKPTMIAVLRLIADNFERDLVNQ